MNSKIPNNIIILLVTLFGAGKSKVAPGTVGSIVSLIFFLLSFYLYKIYFPNSLCGYFIISSLMTILVTIFAIRWIDFYIRNNHRNNHDPKEVVIDEFAGIYTSFILTFLALIGCANIGVVNGIALVDNNVTVFLVSLLCFVTFRFFDITKIFPVSYFDNMDNSYGVMMDDVISGVLSAIVNITVLYLLSHV